MRYLLITPMLALLVACSGQDPAPIAPEAAHARETLPAPGRVVELPGGVDFNIVSHLRSDETHQTKKGATRRKVFYELLEVTPDQAEQAITALLGEAGYVGEAPKIGKNGQYSIRYMKAKAATITVTYFPDLADKPENSAAKSMVSISWQTKKAPKTEVKGEVSSDSGGRAAQ